ncbi:hypothetical protein [Nonomuraea cavernae]|uniref:Uncharacterized protein n=1 Tax=Nonomuraea cavernae TaxID=2045107 RepID=A0A918DPT8_9ACTN|nr:hypothetical protein [Nonomuraea cavernae]MCA2189662.1 hypothetical protein [Nonomuraea cavernae]GGO77460.1 hypothetical protein GCM10012289_57190 [Nonomuraea cavernae]
MPEARTIAEAYVHIGLTVQGEELGRNPDYSRWSTLTEGGDSWTLVFDHAGHHIVLRVPYQTEYDARRDGLHFGTGTSTLVDAGQWVLVSAAYARMAVEDDILSSPDAADGWELARDAAVEAVKFIPEGDEEPPPGAFWTALGTQARAQEPERFTLRRLRDDIDFYQESLDRLRPG